MSVSMPSGLLVLISQDQTPQWIECISQLEDYGTIIHPSVMKINKWHILWLDHHFWVSLKMHWRCQHGRLNLLCKRETRWLSSKPDLRRSTPLNIRRMSRLSFDCFNASRMRLLLHRTSLTRNTKLKEKFQLTYAQISDGISLLYCAIYN